MDRDLLGEEENGREEEEEEAGLVMGERLRMFSRQRSSVWKWSGSSCQRMVMLQIGHTASSLFVRFAKLRSSASSSLFRVSWWSTGEEVAGGVGRKG